MRLDVAGTFARVGRAPSAAAAGLDRRVLWASPRVVLWDARWDRDLHAADRTSTPTIPCFVLMREGAYLKRVGRETAVGNPAHATLYDVGRETVVTHPSGRRTLGTTFLLDGEFFAELRTDLAGGRVDDPATPFGCLAAPVAPRAHLLYRALVRYLDSEPRRDELAVEEAVFALLREVARSLPGERPPRRRTPGRIRARMAEIRAGIAANPARPVTLGELGARLGCSPEYVSRIFPEEAGLPMSRWVARLRLAHAVDRMLQGDAALAEIALEAGFASHSHLTATFTREIGVAPSRVREGPARDRVRRLARALRAPH
jgi:AraC-like DNA-binding protein